MYRVLIVDDEEIELQAFKLILRKELPEIEVVGEASGGRQALELINSLMPDIVTMDIKMPGINGIDALKEIKKNYPTIKVIMVTAHDYFSYAQQSVNLGSFAFLLKPVKINEIKEVMKRVILSIESEREKNKYQLETAEKLSSVLPILEAELAVQIMTGHDVLPNLVKYANILNISFQSGFCMVVEIEKGSDEASNSTDKGYNKFLDEHHMIVRDIFKDVFDCIVSNGVINIIAAFIPVNTGVSDEWVKNYSLEAAKKVQNRINKQLGITVSIGIGILQTDLKKLYISYNQALYSLKSACKEKSICCFTDMEHTYVNNVISGYMEMEKEFSITIRSGAEEDSIKHFNRLFFHANEDFKGDINELQFYIMHLAIAISYIEYEFYNDGILYEKIKNTITIRPGDLLNVKKIMDEEIRQITSVISEHRNIQTEGLVSKACEYIRSNYTKPITLESAAKHVSVSPFYLSKLFKATLGQNFSYYLTSFRMLEAKRLLRETDMSLKSIAYKVGYNDPDYFFKVFKKNSDATPTEYRSRARKSGT